MELIPDINISDFNYSLPEQKIAQFPLSQRDQSRLLIYKNNSISEDVFRNIDTYLPENSLLIYNQTRVIQARLLFHKETGAEIEIFCLEPVEPTREMQQAFEQGSGVIWKCLVGKSKKWKSGKLVKQINIEGKTCSLSVERMDQLAEYSLVKFEWDPPAISFSEILSNTGIVPLPPYMTRDAIDSDKDRYQTVYATSEGSVAAPTAGLHFTENVINKLKHKKIQIEEVTLHVGAGTFRPVNTNNVKEHEMHTESIQVHLSTIKCILKKIDENIIVVGTTTMRTIESLYWYGVKLVLGKTSLATIDIHQWDPYILRKQAQISVKESLEKVIDHMNRLKIEELKGQTQLIIMPGYEYKIPNILITNFHMPKSTLLLLVSAFIGSSWKDVYNYALNKDFRFLSYGDSCLFFK